MSKARTIMENIPEAKRDNPEINKILRKLAKLNREILNVLEELSEYEVNLKKKECTPLEDLGLSVKTMNNIRMAGIYTAEDLEIRTYHIRGIGPYTMKQISEKMQKKKFKIPFFIEKTLEKGVM